MGNTRITAIDGTHCLSFDCGGLPVDEAIITRGHEPNGYFWEGIASFAAADIVDAVELDSEGDMFSATGTQSDLERLQAVMEPLTQDEKALEEVMRRAEADGFEFED
ncbi:immunity protein 51 of polymorphic toxin system [Luteococcus japonicus]|uniref:Immunity protein 51 of polymorphic toxin system n=1 Tax=Luteococcus japonicus TaxID=33984 RepID=A0A3N1ZRX1_9ACTN|nr:Imm51 family immunity protein [Luteococcus japonicus]ROR53468.1 immunity protein 51 of polymorphic toxin system [Luteococcus japonicus]